MEFFPPMKHKNGFDGNVHLLEHEGEENSLVWLNYVKDSLSHDRLNGCSPPRTMNHFLGDLPGGPSR